MNNRAGASSSFMMKAEGRGAEKMPRAEQEFKKKKWERAREVVKGSESLGLPNREHTRRQEL